MIKSFPNWFGYLQGFVLLLAFSMTACAADTADLTAIKKGDNFKVWAGSAPDKTNPQKGVLIVVLEGTTGWKIDPKAPLRIDLKTDDTLSLARASLGKSDRLDPHAVKPRFEVPYQARATGRYPITLGFDFVTCNDSICQKKQFSVEYTLNL